MYETSAAPHSIFLMHPIEGPLLEHFELSSMSQDHIHAIADDRALLRIDDFYSLVLLTHPYC